MNELTKIIFSVVMIILFIQLGLAIAYNWDEESQQNKRLKKNVERFSAITIGTLCVSTLIFILKLIWSD